MTISNVMSLKFVRDVLCIMMSYVNNDHQLCDVTQMWQSDDQNTGACAIVIARNLHVYYHICKCNINPVGPYDDTTTVRIKNP